MFIVRKKVHSNYQVTWPLILCVSDSKTSKIWVLPNPFTVQIYDF